MACLSLSYRLDGDAREEPTWSDSYEEGPPDKPARQPPPPLQEHARYPVTVAVGLAALAATFAWWAEVDVNWLFMDIDWIEQPWRLVTSALPHVNLLHLIFNLYWLWVFGTRVEEVLGHGAAFALMVLFAAGSSVAEYALFEGGVGLSGVGYGLFGMLWVLSSRDRRFAGAVDGRLVVFFLGWFVLCCVLTRTGTWQVANAAHAGGLVLGTLMGFGIAARESRPAFVGLLSATLLLLFLAATVWRPALNFAGQASAELAYRAYEQLEQEHNEKAVELFERAVEMDSGQANWWYNLGVGRQRLGRNEEALNAYQRALELEPGDKSFRAGVASAKGALALQKHEAGQLEEAVQLYRECLNLDERQAWCWHNLGLAYQSLSRLELAQEAFQRAINLEPASKDHRDALNELSRFGDPQK